MKRYREDIKFWEAEVRFLFFTFYKYTVFISGKTISKFRIFKIKRRQAKYFVFKELPLLEIGKKEFYEKYKGNKYIVPVNFKLNLELE